MTVDVITVDFGNPFPVFPLSDAVVLPQAVMPLHVFEPRYRRLMADALDGSGLIAMALFRGQVSKSDYLAGRPALRPYVCISHVQEYDRLPDGRYIVLVQGICRARVLREIPGEPYRSVLVAPATDAPDAERCLTPYRSRLENLIHVRPEAVARSADILPDSGSGDKSLSTAIMVDAAIAALCKDTDQQYALLAQPDVRRRAEWLIQQMESLVGSRVGENARN
jgi:hypothetical protein